MRPKPVLGRGVRRVGRGLSCVVGGAGEIRHRQTEPAADQVDMRIIESGKHGAPLRVDNDRLGALKAGDFAIAADPKDLVAADGDGFGHRAATVGGIDARIPDDEVHGTVVVVALGADHEAGDEGDRDDRDNNVSGQARRHGSSGYEPRSGQRRVRPQRSKLRF